MDVAGRTREARGATLHQFLCFPGTKNRELTDLAVSSYRVICPLYTPNNSHK